MTPPVHRFVRYSGMSMWPCFQDGDLLEVESLLIEQVRRGDCIVFSSDDGCHVVHRVVSAGPALKTRGDAISKIDTREVTQEHLVGRVTRRYRLGVERCVSGGWPGRLAGRFYFIAGRFDPLRPSRGGNIARRLRQLSMTVLGRWSSPGKIRTLSLLGQTSVNVWYWGNWVIGRQEITSEKWSVYWPWRVILNPPRRDTTETACRSVSTAEH
jgi:hypothetical protein